MSAYQDGKSYLKIYAVDKKQVIYSEEKVQRYYLIVFDKNSNIFLWMEPFYMPSILREKKENISLSFHMIRYLMMFHLKEYDLNNLMDETLYSTKNVLAAPAYFKE